MLESPCYVNVLVQKMTLRIIEGRPLNIEEKALNTCRPRVLTESGHLFLYSNFVRNQSYVFERYSTRWYGNLEYRVRPATMSQPWVSDAAVGSPADCSPAVSVVARTSGAACVLGGSAGAGVWFIIAE